MTYLSPSGHTSDRRDFIDELNEAIRQNPVPAALIGAGLLWMFMGGAKNTVLGGASRSLFGGLAQVRSRPARQRRGEFVKWAPRLPRVRASSPKLLEKLVRRPQAPCATQLVP